MGVRKQKIKQPPAPEVTRAEENKNMIKDFSDTRNALVIETTDDGYFIYHRGGGKYPYGAAIGSKTIDIAMTIEGARNAIKDHRAK